MQLLQRNIDRVNKLVASLVSTGAFVQSLFTWQYKFRSAFAFAVSIFSSTHIANEPFNAYRFKVK